MVRVETGARLHFGFQNLSLAHERLYGGIGLALDTPGVVIEAEQAQVVTCEDSELEPFVADAVAALDVPGAAVTVRDRFDRHIGLGSGTQFALASLVAVSRTYGESVDPRAMAPDLGRGGRSGVGVATFEDGGFVVDAGHPTERFTTAPPDPGTWTVPRPVARHDLPSDWRIVLILPATSDGLSGSPEEETMRAVVERADAGIADEVATLLTRRLLPAAANGDLDAFGAAVTDLGRLNGAWYADEQGGVYRPPAGRLLRSFRQDPSIAGAGQSSWGPTVYGLTSADRVAPARSAAQRALEATEAAGSVRIVPLRNRGVTFATE